MAVFSSWSTTRSNTACGQALADVPSGWRVVYGEADRAACLNYIEQNWTDIGPKNLRKGLAQRQAFDT
jgi:uncharacterized protein YbdZ (MbtH family)